MGVFHPALVWETNLLFFPHPMRARADALRGQLLLVSYRNVDGALTAISSSRRSTQHESTSDTFLKAMGLLSLRFYSILHPFETRRQYMHAVLPNHFDVVSEYVLFSNFLVLVRFFHRVSSRLAHHILYPNDPSHSSPRISGIAAVGHGVIISNCTLLTVIPLLTLVALRTGYYRWMPCRALYTIFDRYGA